VGIVVVTYGHTAELPELLAALEADQQLTDQLVVVDNHPEHGCAAIAELHPAVTAVLRSDNVGFAAGCNRGVAMLRPGVDQLFFLNPDVVPDPGAVMKLRRSFQDDWGACMGLVVLPDGTINSAGNTVHMSGLSWCDDFGSYAKTVATKEQVQVVSGACALIKKSVWDQIGGFCETYFMYYEDTDLSAMITNLGLSLGIVPDAIFRHDYTFHKGDYKWFYLERNRYVYIIRQWPLILIVLLLPLLIACEIGLWLVSIKQRRFWLRLQSIFSAVRLLPPLLRQRKIVQNMRQIDCRAVLSGLRPELHSPFLGLVGSSKVLNTTFKLYYAAVKFFLNISATIQL
jgi:GT2 family glycosyltransferase